MTKKQDIWVVYSTFPNQKEAILLGKKLVDKRLVACVNIHSDITSLFRWKGKINKASEAAFSAKTHRKNIEKVIAEIKHLHSYDTPCIIAYPVAKGFTPFLEWVAEESV